LKGLRVYNRDILRHDTTQKTSSNGFTNSRIENPSFSNA
jgi:hypothetical protein